MGWSVIDGNQSSPAASRGSGEEVANLSRARHGPSKQMCRPPKGRRDHPGMPASQGDADMFVCDKQTTTQIPVGDARCRVSEPARRESLSFNTRVGGVHEGVCAFVSALQFQGHGLLSFNMAGNKGTATGRAHPSANTSPPALRKKHVTDEADGPHAFTLSPHSTAEFAMVLQANSTMCGKPPATANASITERELPLWRSLTPSLTPSLLLLRNWPGESLDNLMPLPYASYQQLPSQTGGSIPPERHFGGKFTHCRRNEQKHFTAVLVSICAAKIGVSAQCRPAAPSPGPPPPDPLCS
ncbi:unnamed protein product [Pleuronectes platessa]|uniref:Uncharacterized protein n=1 Tax=Pleuronectes platessa TaxID=8262 RepID=A0A9N7TU13_PLEPL|nr:unnamed protein product [Pleuronectes platessa]